ncbi:hypothetical protein [Levilactobacillus bambusae]|uniref:hypothetical protein n=1 Tax=Levilactobacillus bambusae TaxID=2024736 RepID=UPI001402F6B2|nr:hypothetical protein [Levilactobacillus bambusae]
MESIFKLQQAPVSFIPHAAVQREIILSEALSKSSEQDEQIQRTGSRLADSVTRWTLPLYLRTNVKIQSQWPGLYQCESKDDGSQPTSDKWTWAYWMLHRHPEVERVAMVDAATVTLNQNPFPEMDADCLYVADELNELEDLQLLTQTIPEVNSFIVHNSRLQTLNPAVIAGERGIVLELLSGLITLKRTMTADQINNLTDLSLFNYVLYRYFTQRLGHGRLVTSIMSFNQHETNAWFKLQ